MKQKYILETYDQILKEIKNPKLVFDNDFVSFLENCAIESYLIFKVNFIKQNGEVNFVIKKPIHNLHPKVAEITCEECEPDTEFETYIPAVLQNIEGKTDSLQFRWLSRNGNISLYILQFST